MPPIAALSGPPLVFCNRTADDDLRRLGQVAVALVQASNRRLRPGRVLLAGNRAHLHREIVDHNASASDASDTPEAAAVASGGCFMA
jgi:hypothetical protein